MQPPTRIRSLHQQDLNSCRRLSEDFRLSRCCQSLSVRLGRAVSIGPQPSHKSCGQQHRKKKPCQRYCVSVSDIKPHSHQQSPKRARQHEYAECISVCRAKRSQSEIPAQRVRDDVSFGSPAAAQKKNAASRGVEKPVFNECPSAEIGRQVHLSQPSGQPTVGLDTSLGAQSICTVPSIRICRSPCLLFC